MIHSHSLDFEQFIRLFFLLASGVISHQNADCAKTWTLQLDNKLFWGWTNAGDVGSPLRCEKEVVPTRRVRCSLAGRLLTDECPTGSVEMRHFVACLSKANLDKFFLRECQVSSGFVMPPDEVVMVGSGLRWVRATNSFTRPGQGHVDAGDMRKLSTLFQDVLAGEPSVIRPVAELSSSSMTTMMGPGVQAREMKHAIGVNALEIPLGKVPVSTSTTTCLIDTDINLRDIVAKIPAECPGNDVDKKWFFTRFSAFVEDSGAAIKSNLKMLSALAGLPIAIYIPKDGVVVCSMMHNSSSHITINLCTGLLMASADISKVTVVDMGDDMYRKPGHVFVSTVHELVGSQALTVSPGLCIDPLSSATTLGPVRVGKRKFGLGMIPFALCHAQVPTNTEIERCVWVEFTARNYEEVSNIIGTIANKSAANVYAQDLKCLSLVNNELVVNAGSQWTGTIAKGGLKSGVCSVWINVGLASTGLRCVRTHQLRVKTSSQTFEASPKEDKMPNKRHLYIDERHVTSACPETLDDSVNTLTVSFADGVLDTHIADRENSAIEQIVVVSDSVIVDIDGSRRARGQPIGLRWLTSASGGVDSIWVHDRSAVPQWSKHRDSSPPMKYPRPCRDYNCKDGNFAKQVSEKDMINAPTALAVVGGVAAEAAVCPIDETLDEQVASAASIAITHSFLHSAEDEKEDETGVFDGLDEWEQEMVWLTSLEHVKHVAALLGKEGASVTNYPWKFISDNSLAADLPMEIIALSTPTANPQFTVWIFDLLGKSLDYLIPKDYVQSQIKAEMGTIVDFWFAELERCALIKMTDEGIRYGPVINRLTHEMNPSLYDLMIDDDSSTAHFSQFERMVVKEWREKHEGHLRDIEDRDGFLEFTAAQGRIESRASDPSQRFVCV